MSVLRRVRRFAGFVAEGVAPLPLAHLRLRRSARHPVTFTQKVLHKMAHDRRPILRQFADKAAARDYVAERVGGEYLTAVYSITADPGALDWDALPREFVAKATHGSGNVVIVSSAALAESRLPSRAPKGWHRYLVRPESVDRAALTALMEQWMSSDYYARPGKLPEWCYRGIRPQILIEELLVAERGEIPIDYKFFTFDGVCRFIQVESQRATDHRRDTFAPDWTPIDSTGNYPRSATVPRRPENLAAMVDIAEELGRGIDFVRVDLYSIGERVVFGELTNYPEGGRLRITPPEFDRVWGSYWTLPTGRLR
jgi:hypothetical protein